MFGGGDEGKRERDRQAGLKHLLGGDSRLGVSEQVTAYLCFVDICRILGQ